jgi:sarcosine oxidase subunit alpha
MGEVIEFQGENGNRVAARIVDACFFDKAGDKQNV